MTGIHWNPDEREELYDKEARQLSETLSRALWFMELHPDKKGIFAHKQKETNEQVRSDQPGAYHASR